MLNLYINNWLYEIFLYLLKAIWFLLPAYVANSTPVIVYKLKILDYPMDFYKRIKGKRIFGDHKTWRGLVFGVLFGTLTAIVQKYLLMFDIIKNISVYDYSNAILFGFLMSLGALLGDAIESFFKRQLNIPPGKDWIFFDQYDFIIGSLIFTWQFLPKDPKLFIAILIISPILHVLSNYLKPLFMKK